MSERVPHPPATVAIKCAEDARLWGVHLSAEQRGIMDALVERLLWLVQEAHPNPALGAGRLFEHMAALDPEVRRLAERLHFPKAAKRRGFFLQYLADALQARAARAGPARVALRSDGNGAVEGQAGDFTCHSRKPCVEINKT